MLPPIISSAELTIEIKDSKTLALLTNSYYNYCMSIDCKLIESIKNICKDHVNIEKVILFGSRARGDHTQKSDYDLAIYGQLQPSEIVLLRNALREDLPTLHKIDTVFMQSETDSKLIKNIENEGILIYDKTCQ